MKSPSRISGALAASLALAVSGCADGRDAPTAPSATSTPSSMAAPPLDRGALKAAADAMGGEGARLAAAVRDATQRAHLESALARLTRAMELGDAVAARRALDTAREGLRFVESDADRDALRLALDAAAESLGKEEK